LIRTCLDFPRHRTGKAPLVIGILSNFKYASGTRKKTGNNLLGMRKKLYKVPLPRTTKNYNCP
jgi:hypothetical protein